MGILRDWRKNTLKKGHSCCGGELVQVDGSEHWWFEDRGPQCTLLVFVDDATGRLMKKIAIPREVCRLHSRDVCDQMSTRHVRLTDALHYGSYRG
jgi:hypothetical protein